MIPRTTACALLLALVTGCSGSASDEPQGEPGPISDDRPRALLQLRSRGESSVGSRPEFVFTLRTAGYASDPSGPSERAALLLSHVVVERGAGGVPVELKADELTTVTGERLIRLTPAVDLGSDQWFNLRLYSDGDLVLGTINDRPDEARQMLETPSGTSRPSLVLPMFTGSLPHAIAVNVRTAPPKPLLISLTFSEPVVMGDLVEGLSFTSSIGALPGCVIDPFEQACVQASSTTAMSRVDFQLDSPPAALPDLAVHLAAVVRGASRTVGEAAALSSGEPQAVSTWSIQPGDWYDGSGRGESQSARQTGP